MKVVIFGGSGFIGQYIVKQLAQQGHVVKIFSRHNTHNLKVCGDVGQIVCVEGNILNEQLIEKHLIGMDVAINLVGILSENNTNQFNSIHNIAAKNIAKYAQTLGLKQLIHFSALTTSNNSKYSKSKLAGEEAVKKEFPNVVIIRPSVVFGNEDKFFHMFAKLITISPFMPLIGGGKALMQPVYAGDIAKFVHCIIAQKLKNKVYNVVGPKSYSFKELIQLIIKIINRSCILLYIPFSISKLIAWVLEFRLVSFLMKPITGSSNPIFTRDQVELLKHDNISEKNGLKEMRIQPTPLEKIIPQYLQHYKRNE